MCVGVSYIRTVSVCVHTDNSLGATLSMVCVRLWSVCGCVCVWVCVSVCVYE